jgi:hypothetical protein
MSIQAKLNNKASYTSSKKNETLFINMPLLQDWYIDRYGKAVPLPPGRHPPILPMPRPSHTIKGLKVPIISNPGPGGIAWENRYPRNDGVGNPLFDFGPYGEIQRQELVPGPHLNPFLPQPRPDLRLLSNG